MQKRVNNWVVKKSRIILIGIIIISLLLVLTYKNAILQEGNPLPVFKGILELYATSNDLVSISVTRDKFIAKSGTSHQALLSYAQKQGWTYIDQLGAGIMFETYTKAITVTSRMYSRFFVVYTVTVRDKEVFWKGRV